MKRRTFLAAGALLVLASIAPARSAEKLNVVTSFSILADMVREIGGDRVEVKTLVGPDGDAHAFDPAPADAKALTQAGLFVVNGLGFEPWQKKLVDASGFAGPVVVASEGVAVRHMDHGGKDHEHGDHEAFDPHAWQDLRNGIAYSRNIAAALAKADPASGKDYEQRAQAYVAKLEALNADIRARLAEIPEVKRKVITSHDAFGYFGEAYGIAFLAPEGLSTEAEPSAGDVAKLITQIRQEGIKAFFVENVSDPRLIEMIASETGAVPGGALYSDALSPPDGPAASYMAMFQNNVKALIEGMNKQ
jgi:zinc/manganese transport system substrate-binding protein